MKTKTHRPQNSSETQNLFRMLRSGDIKVFEYLYVDNYALVRDYLVKWNIRYEDAEEIAQEVLVTIWERRGNFFGVDNKQLFRYIYTTAKSMAIKLERAKKRQAQLHNELLQSYGDHVETPEEFVISQQLQAKIDAVFMSMSPVRHQIYKLKYDDNCSNSEIANRLSLDPNTIRWHIHMVKTTLNELLEDQ